MRITKRIDLERLDAEIDAAGVPDCRLVLVREEGKGDELLAVLPDGSYGPLPDGAAPVVAAHTPAPAVAAPDYGEDAPADYERQLAGAVTSLRAYLSLPAPAPVQTVGTVKLLIRVVLFLSRRVIR